MIRITLDTNIIFYAFDPQDARKHSIAKRILAACYDKTAPVSLQCLSEFYRSATKKKLVLPAQAAAIVSVIRKGMSIVPSVDEDLVLAMQIHQQHGFQFFDCLLAATVTRAGCTTLLSEDFQHNQIISGLTIVNPFKLSENELSFLLQ